MKKQESNDSNSGSYLKRAYPGQQQSIKDPKALAKARAGKRAASTRNSVTRRLLSTAYAFVFAVIGSFVLPSPYLQIGFVCILFGSAIFDDFMRAKGYLSYFKDFYSLFTLASAAALLGWLLYTESHPLPVAYKFFTGEIYLFPIAIVVVPILVSFFDNHPE